MSEIEDGTGRSGSITDWNQHDVPSMWRTLEHQRPDAQWRQVAGWRKTAELAQVHLGRLRLYRDALSRAWPPERSAAARAYLTRLDHLIDSMAQTAEVASMNYAVLAATTGAIAAAQSELETIDREYVDKRRVKEAYERQVAELAAIGYHPWQRPPVSETEMDRLNTRARTLMFGLSGELLHAQTQIRQPPTYERRPSIDVSDPDAYGSTNPPTIPPVVPVPTDRPGHSASTLQQRPLDRHPASWPAVSPGIGPMLGSATPLVGDARAPAVPPGVSGSPALPIGSGLPPMPMPPWLPPAAGRPLPGTLPPNVSTTPGGGPLRAPAGEVTGPPRAMPPGGVIGGVPPAAAGVPARQVNPIGGVISNGMIGVAGSAPGERAGPRPATPTTRSPIWTTPVGDPFVRPGDPTMATNWREIPAAGRTWDPDDPWRTERGVPPVLLPPAEPGQPDPGPAIGLDR